ncbi:ethionine resistance protein, partial [Linderina pennispora]
VLFAQGITNPLPYLTLLGMLTTVGAQWLLVWSPYFRLGISGIALSNGLSYLLMLCATLWVISRNNMHRIWGGIGFHAPWLPFLRLMPPCLVLALFSTGTNELITMATTQLGASSLAVQSVLSALGRMFMISASSAGVASLNRTGNLIGERAVRGACITAHVSLCIGLAIAVLGGLALALAPELWIGMFTSDPATIDDAVRLLPVAAVAYATQAVSFVGSQLISAQGRQGLAVRIKTITLYTIGVPLGYYWTMVEDHGLLGLWAAVAVGQACTAAAETIVLLRTRWPELIEKCSSTITSSV